MTDLLAEQFSNPHSIYRGAPLWSWNTQLRWDALRDQIDCLAQMGMGGFYMHSRVGLDTPYLGKEFMHLVKRCVGYAKQKGMAACLYDEDRWPSGAAGGLALKGHPEFRAQHLLITPRPYGTIAGISSRASAKAWRSENGRLLAAVELEYEPGGLVSYRTVEPSHPHNANMRYIYVETNPLSEWFNGETYVDTLNPDAIAAFIRCTHEVYQTAVGEEFGSTVPTMFTDEPQHSHRDILKDSADTSDIFLPWTTEFTETFTQATGSHDLVARVVELVWDVQGRRDETMRTRWEFTDHLTERFVSATLDQMADWCKGVKLQLTGHLMNEPTLLAQTCAVGEVMRAYRNMDVPGVDMLCERIELNSVKQASSVARQQRGGRAWAVSEIYGVTNWTMTFAEHKRLGDWQAALGINRRVHHLSPVSIVGEGKRDYPAAISYQSPWYKEYPYIEDHFARINLALTTGTALTRVAVIHPIESFWLCFGPKKTNMSEMVMRDTMFKELTDWLLYGMIDFDFVAESLLPDQAQGTRVGHCEYEVIIVPNLRSIRRTTVDFLNRFAQAGGRVLVAGSRPDMVDARPDVPELNGERVDFNRFHILSQLERHRDVMVVDSDGVPSKTLLHQIRSTDNGRILFVSNIDGVQPINAMISVTGQFDVEILDTLDGSRHIVTSDIVDGLTTFAWLFDPSGSVLANLTPRVGHPGRKQTDFTQYGDAGPLKLVGTDFSEPNVLLLDFASYRIDDGDWQGPTEILRVGNIVRAQSGLPLIGEATAQPWSISSAERQARCDLSLRFDFSMACDIDSPLELAVEVAEGMVIELDGRKLEMSQVGWWVDKGISRLDLCNGLTRGDHSIVVSYPFGRLSHTERLYVLGDFGVDVRAAQGVMIPKTDLCWGDWTRQGRPYYVGNVTYRCSFAVDTPSPVIIQVPHFEGPVVTVTVPSLSIKRTIAQSSIADLGVVPAGPYQVEITCFGNRNNAFGLLHLTPGTTHWCSPNEFRTTGQAWTEEYVLCPMGVQVAPRLKLLGAHLPAPRLNRDRPLHVTLSDPVGGPILGPKRR